MKIAIGADHGGFELKESIKKHLEEVGGYEICDYVTEEKILGILCCGTGIGISLAANKVKGIRAACCSDYFSAKLTRAHNDANILCLGGRVVGAGLANELVDIFLTTEFEGGRHQRRIDQISAIENGIFNTEE